MRGVARCNPRKDLPCVMCTRAVLVKQADAHATEADCFFFSFRILIIVANRKHTPEGIARPHPDQAVPHDFSSQLVLNRFVH